MAGREAAARVVGAVVREAEMGVVMAEEVEVVREVVREVEREAVRYIL